MACRALGKAAMRRIMQRLADELAKGESPAAGPAAKQLAPAGVLRRGQAGARPKRAPCASDDSSDSSSDDDDAARSSSRGFLASVGRKRVVSFRAVRVRPSRCLDAAVQLARSDHRARVRVRVRVRIS